MKRAILVSLCVLIVGCARPKTASSDEPTQTRPVSAPAGEPVPSGRCAIKNDATHAIELIDAAIQEPLGTVTPGEAAFAGGHFEARTATGLAANGFCPSGHTVRVIEKSGRLHAVMEDGSPAQEGVGD